MILPHPNSPIHLQGYCVFSKEINGSIGWRQRMYGGLWECKKSILECCKRCTDVLVAFNRYILRTFVFSFLCCYTDVRSENETVNLELK